MRALPPKAVIFDFDYTLADASRGTIACVAHALERHGLDAVSADDVRRTIGLTLEETFLRLTKAVEPHVLASLCATFLEHSAVVMVRSATVLPHVELVTARLCKLGARLAIVSTKYRSRIEGILERSQLRGRFELIVAGDEVTQPKPHPEGLEQALDRLQLRPEEALYVGDSVIDAETAARASVPFIAVLTGTTGAAAFAAYPCRAVLPDLATLACRSVVAGRSG